MGAIKCAQVEQYLLEKSRITGQQIGERNYHIFYMLNKGGSADMKSKMQVTKCEDYAYIMGGQCPDLKKFNDVEEWEIVLGAMKVLNFTQEFQDDIFSIVAAVLHLGYLEFEAAEVNGQDASEISNDGPLKVASQLLKCSEDALNDGIVTRSIVTRGEVTVKPLTVDKAADVCDAFSKGIYGRCFIDIVTFITIALFKEKEPGEVRSTIGVLDIFGFECFDFNSFEQLCINYCNESLQQFFVHHIFKMEQMECVVEPPGGLVGSLYSRRGMRC